MTSRARELAKLVRERGLTGCMTLGYEIAAELERLARLDEQTAKVVVPEPPASRCVHTSLDDFQGCDHGQREFVPVKQIPSELILMKGFWESADGEVVSAVDLCDDQHTARRFRPMDEPWMAVVDRALRERHRKHRAERAEELRELKGFARFVDGGTGEGVVPVAVVQSLKMLGPGTGWKATFDGHDIKMRHASYPLYLWHIAGAEDNRQTAARFQGNPHPMIPSIAHFLTGPISPPIQIPVWLVWLAVALFNLLVNARLWADWRISYRGTRLEAMLRKVNAVCLLTWPISGFVFLPVFFATVLICGVGILLYYFGRALALAASRTLPDAISVLSGERR